jgi:outer membrane protein OmpA-like peptidoglycan-associated protein
MKLILITLICFSISVGYAQLDILEKVKDKVEEKAEEKTDEAIDEAIDEATENKEEEQKEEKAEEEIKKEEISKEKSSSSEKKEGLKSFSKYDFIPGDQVLFYEDFSQDNIGDFPALWNTNSSGEVVTLNNYPGHWFQVGNDGIFIPDIKGSFGDNFTMEFDLVYAPTANTNLPDYHLEFISGKRDGETIDAYVPGNGGVSIGMGAYSSSVSGWKDQNYGEVSNSKDITILKDNKDKKVRVSFSFQKQRVRFWLNEEKIYDLPRLLASGLVIDRIRFSTTETDDQKPYLYLTNIRIASGKPDMRSKLLTEGKLVTHGILFDVNSDKIKPESYGTLKEIANVLKENSSVRVKIVGHTDSDGDEVSNLDLSKRRALSVKNSLNSEFGIDTSRLETDGKGESQPASDNNSPEGKANNRRVEFIKL